MNSFSFRRFALTLRYLGVVKWRAYVNCLAVPFLISAVMLASTGDIWTPRHHGFVVSTSLFRFALMIGAQFFCTRALCPSGRTGGDYALFLALPASHAEKFLASLVMRVVAPALCATMGYLASVLVVNPMAIGEVLAWGFFSFTWPCSFGVAMRVGLSLMLPLAVVCSLSFFLFAGVYFSRFKWVLAFLAQVLIVVLLDRVGIEIGEFIDLDDYDVNDAACVWWVDAILFAVAALLVFASYRVFRCSQAVKGRFVTV